jgi:hypothetical protein
MITEAVGEDGQVKVNYLPTTLSGTTRSWLINLPEGSIYNWDQLCTMCIKDFQGTYERSSIAMTRFGTMGIMSPRLGRKE